MSVSLPLVADYIAALDGKATVHAVVADEMWARFGKRKLQRRTVPTLCGMQRTRFYAVKVCYTDRDEGTSIMPWPPRLAFVKKWELRRCQDCYEATGKPRPNPSWDEIREGSDCSDAA